MSFPCGFSSKSMDKTKNGILEKSVPGMCKNVATWSLKKNSKILKCSSFPSRILQDLINDVRAKWDHKE